MSHGFWNGADSDSVAVGVRELDFAGPRLGFYFYAELSCDGVYVVDIEVGHGVIRGITGVFGEMKVYVASTEEGIEREAGSETMLTNKFKPYSRIPSSECQAVGCTKDGDEFFSHSPRICEEHRPGDK
jgi:hypothetical protein